MSRPAHRKPVHTPKPVPKQKGKPSNAGSSIPFLNQNYTPSPTEGLLASLLILLVTFLLYGRTIHYGYVLDDRIVITDNAYTTRGVAGIPDLLSKETFEGYFKQKMILVEGGRYRPLSLVTFAIEWSLFAKEKKTPDGQALKDATGRILYEGNPLISHLVNLILYAFTGILLFLLLYRMFPAGAKRKWFLNIPLAASLLFILHPVHTEAVANIKGRDEIMAMMGAILALYYTLRYVQAPGHKGKILHLILASFFFFLGLLSKENTVTFIFIIPLTIWFFTDAKFKNIFIATIPIFFVTLIYSIIRIKAVGLISVGKEITELINNPFYGMPFTDKYATIFYTLWIYIKLLFFPHPLTIDYYPYHIPWLNWGDPRAFLPLLLYLGLAVTAWKGFRRKTTPSYVILYFILTLSVTSNIFFSIGSFMNERFVYMSSLAFCILVAWISLDKMPQWLKPLNYAGFNMAGLLVLLLFTGGFTLKTNDRIPDWKDELSLDRAAVRVSPGSARANCFMGVAMFDNLYKPRLDSLARKKQADPGFNNSASDTLWLAKIADSINWYVDRSLKIYPQYSSALITKSGIAAELYKLGRYDAARLLDVYDTLVKTGVELPFIKEFTTYFNTHLKVMVAIAGDEAKRKSAQADVDRLKAFYISAFDFYYNTLNDRRRSNDFIQLASALDPADPVIAEKRSLVQDNKPQINMNLPVKTP